MKIVHTEPKMTHTFTDYLFTFLKILIVTTCLLFQGKKRYYNQLISLHMLDIQSQVSR